MAERLELSEAAARVRPADSIGLPVGPGQPPALLAELGRRDDWEELRVYGALLLVGTERVMAAATPDERGWCSLSLHAGGTATEMKRAADDPDRLLIVEASPHFPHTGGIGAEYPHAVHLDEIDILVESEVKPFPLIDPPPSEAERAIAEHARGYVSDGDTLQTGIGAIPSTIAALLADGDGGDYGVHSEMFTTGLMELHRAGKVTNRKGQFDGVSVATFSGTPRSSTSRGSAVTRTSSPARRCRSRRRPSSACRRRRLSMASSAPGSCPGSARAP